VAELFFSSPERSVVICFQFNKFAASVVNPALLRPPDTPAGGEDGTLFCQPADMAVEEIKQKAQA
jgi:hypothetical protein